jgi:ubiquinone/menaquinone biosynthesis C-methylase UbiE
MSGRALADIIAAYPAVYDSIQRLAGRDAVARRMQPWLAELSGRVLDVGGGTGRTAEWLGTRAKYVCVDLERRKLVAVRDQSDRASAVVGDGLSLPLADASVDAALLIAVIHHIEPSRVSRLLGEIARVLTMRGTLIVLDAVRSPRVLSRLMWSIDRGSHPQTADSIARTTRASFEIESAQTFAVLHEYCALRCRKRREVG